MSAFGTAPRRIPGPSGQFVWVTATGHRLNPAQSIIWDRYYKLGATDGRGHFNHNVGAMIHRAQSASPAVRKTAGRQLGNVARQQQHQLQSQADAGLSAITFGGSDIAGALARDIGSIVAHPTRHRSVRNVGKSATGRLANDWFVAPVKKAVEHPSAANIGLGGLAAASLFPGWGGFGRAAREVRAAKLTREATGGATAKIAPRVVRVKRDPIGNYSMPDVPLEEIAAAMPRSNTHLYHSTSASSLPRISTEGLRPGKVREGEIHGVYFAEDGVDIFSLRPDRHRAGDVWLRVRKDAIPVEKTDMYKAGSDTAEWVSRHRISPAAIEYYGEDGAWHPLVPRAEQGTAGPESFVTDAIPAMKQAREVQKAGYTAERAKRLAAYKKAYHEAGGGEAGHVAGLEALRGELPKVSFHDLTGLTDTDMAKLFHTVDNNPLLGDWETIKLKEALRNARRGITPQDNEIALMRKAFGLGPATEFANVGLGSKIARTALDVLNIPRAVMSSADVSAVLRQSLVATMQHPGVAAKNIGPMFRMAFSQKFYDDAMAAIHNDPRFYAAVHDDGLKMTEVAGPLSKHEEAYPSNLAEKIPLAGRLVKGSERAYTGFINVMRWHVYSTLLDLGEAEGKLTPAMRRDAARVANWATGRGDLPGKALEQAAPLLNTVFFSPRLMASRFQTFNPLFYASLDPVARKYAMKAAIKTMIAGMTVLGAAAAAGAKVGTDPTSADFGKIRIGDTRLDVWGGHQQWVRLAGQLYTGRVTSTTTGKTINLKGGPFGTSRWDVASRFLQGKFSPPASLIRDWTHNTDFQGKPFSWKKAAISRAYPLLIQDMLDTYHEYGLGPAAAAYGIGAWGVGVQTYRKKESTAKKKGSKSRAGGGNPNDPWSGGGRRSTRRSSGGGSANPWAK